MSDPPPPPPQEGGEILVPVSNPTAQQNSSSATPHSDDDSNYFLSEPSLSEGSSSAKVLAPNRVGSSEEELERYRRRIGRRSQIPSPAISPGNTSLSSWENSPALPKKVLLQFVMPDSKYKQQQQQQNDNKPDSHVKLSGTNPHELTVQVIHSNNHHDEAPGAALEGKGSEVPLPDVHNLPPIRRQKRTASESTGQDSSGLLGTSQHTLDSLALSDSDMGQSDTGDDRRRVKWELSTQPHHHSADDEKTVERPPRIRKAGHHRTRSGDDVAARLATGGKQYKGMEENHQYFVEDEEDDESNEFATQQYFHDASAAAPYQSDRHFGPWSPVADSRDTWMQQMHQLHDNGQPLDRSVMSSVAYQQSPDQNPQLESPLGRVHDPLADALRASPRPGSLHSVTESPDEDGLADSYSSDGGDEDLLPSGRDNRLPFNRHEPLLRLGAAYEGNESRDRNKAIRGQLSSHSSHHSPFANMGQKSAEKASRSVFLPSSYEDNPNYATFICPRCNTRQREFFTVDNAASQMEGAGSYLALYFAIYVMCSLFIFGLEEGWVPLDCIYFAVITLTTAGLGDYVPTSNANKIICSIFIYFGVACIGLLLGSYIAGMLDDRAYRDQKKKQMESCPNCAKLRTLREDEEKRRQEAMLSSIQARRKSCVHMSERMENGQSPAVYTSSHHHHRNHHHGSHHGSNHSNSFTSSSGEYDSGRAVTSTDDFEGFDPYVENGVWQFGAPPPPPPGRPPPPFGNSPLAATPQNSRLLGSPLTRQILGRQQHTRHHSIDIGNQNTMFAKAYPKMYGSVRRFSEDIPSYEETPPAKTRSSNRGSAPSKLLSIESSDGLEGDYDDSDDESSSYYTSSSYSSTEEIFDQRKTQIQTAKYVFLTLRTALVNSMVIIAVGCFGFWAVEGFSVVDSWYFTTVLLTTVGYGDIVPVTKGGKLFATVYILVAGTILLNNMSTISMIPLELRRRRIERTILTQFGEHLDDAALRELATGPLIQRLRLSANRTDGLDECTREMFALAMLVRLGKVNEQDIRDTFASFRRLDVNNEGVLNSKSIIAGMIKKRRNTSLGIQTQDNGYPAQTPPPPPLQSRFGAVQPRNPFGEPPSNLRNSQWQQQECEARNKD